MRLWLFFTTVFIGSFQFRKSSYNFATVHGYIQRLVTSLLNGFGLEHSLPRKKEGKMLLCDPNR